MFASLITRQLSNFVGMELQKIVQKIEAFASPTLAGSWDNVGLLIKPSGPKLGKKKKPN